MPVYERGYTHWESTGGRTYPPWWVIARRGITEPLRSRWFLLLLVLAWIPAVVKGTIIYVKARTGNLLDLLGGGWASLSGDGVLAFIEGQRFFVFLLMAIVGARLIAMDRRDNGLALYFSRPLGMFDYIAGKTLIILFYYLCVTLFPVYALCVFGYLVSAGITGVNTLVVIPLQTTLFCLLAGVGMSLVLLAFSSVGKRTIFITVWWTILFMGSEAISALFSAGGFNWLEFLNFAGQYHNTGSLLLGTDPRLDIAQGVSVLSTLLYAALALLILRRFVRPVEVVS